MLLPEDVIGLADASPVEFDANQLSHVAGIFRLAMRGTESRAALMKILKRGTLKLGGEDAQRRDITALILAKAEMHEAAKWFEMSAGDLKRATKKADPAPIIGVADWEQLLTALRANSNDKDARQAVLDDMHDRLLQQLETHSSFNSRGP